MEATVPFPTPINRRIVCIGGFTQGRYEPTGIEKAWRLLRATYERPQNGTHVSLHPWNDRWCSLAEHMLRTGPSDRLQLGVCIVAYSWGVGHGAVSLARCLGRLDVAVRVLVSCDGVYRSGRALWRSMWSPLLGEPRIVVPGNVRRVEFFRQRVNRPHGHALVAENDHTELIDRGLLQLSHARIDDSRAFHSVALQACA